MKTLIVLMMFLVSLSLVSAPAIDNPNLPIVKPGDTNLPRNSSTSLNITVNNTEYFQGYTPTSLWAYYTGLGNALWCQLTGCTMQGDIDLNSNNIINGGDINATSFYGDGSGLTGISTVYPHDQDLNTTDNVTFNNVNISCEGLQGANQSCFNVSGDAYFRDIHARDGYFAASTLYIGDQVKLSAEGATGSVLNITGGNVSADYYYGSGQFLTDLNLTDVTIDGGVIIADNISALEQLALNGTFIYDWSIFEVSQYEEVLTGTPTAGVLNLQTTTSQEFEITQIIVEPTTASTTYRFEAVEFTDGSMIDRNRKLHRGEWNIYKSHVIDDKVNISITSASVDELFTVTIKYLDNYT